MHSNAGAIDLYAAAITSTLEITPHCWFQSRNGLIPDRHSTISTTLNSNQLMWMPINISLNPSLSKHRVYIWRTSSVRLLPVRLLVYTLYLICVFSYLFGTSYVMRKEVYCSFSYKFFELGALQTFLLLVYIK